ncbi:MAG: Zn-dependent alcohol dehydrogenase [Fimbriimonadaceae bacterium]
MVVTTRAAVLRKVGGPIRIETLDLAPPGSGEVRVKVAACGVCHSDWHLVTGDTRHPLPVVLGHEGCGWVDAVGPDVTHVRAGDLVALSWAPYCGQCFYCQHGKPNLCDAYVGPIWAGTMLDGSTRLSDDHGPVYTYCALGAFADYVVVPAVSCVQLPPETPPHLAALIGCAVMTGVGSVLNTAGAQPGDAVAVFGVGGVGLSTVMGAKMAGAHPIVAVDPLASRREAALDLGATHATSPEDALAIIRELTEGRGADIVFEAVGLPQVQERCLEAARPGGTIVFSGLSPMGTATNLPGAILVREEKTVRGSYYGTGIPDRDFVTYARAMGDGRLPLNRLVSHEYSLDQIELAFADMLAGVSRRGVIRFD